MFSLHDFVLKTIKGMVGMYPEFQVREYALNWYSKGILTEADLADVEMWFTQPSRENIEEETYEQDVVEEPMTSEENTVVPETEKEEVMEASDIEVEIVEQENVVESATSE